MGGIPTLTTDRLLLRPFQAGDAAHVQRLAGDRAVAATTTNIPHPYEDGMAEEWIAGHEEQFRAQEAGVFAITLREGGALVGAISLFGMIPEHRAEMGYWIGVPHWNHGYCTEAACTVLDFGFRTLRLNRMYATHFARNTASGRVMQKLGMTYEGTQRQHVKKWGVYDDLVHYGILKPEWEAS